MGRTCNRVKFEDEPLLPKWIGDGHVECTEVQITRLSCHISSLILRNDATLIRPLGPLTCLYIAQCNFNKTSLLSYLIFSVYLSSWGSSRFISFLLFDPFWPPLSSIPLYYCISPTLLPAINLCSLELQFFSFIVSLPDSQAPLQSSLIRDSPQTSATLTPSHSRSCKTVSKT